MQFVLYVYALKKEYTFREAARLYNDIRLFEFPFEEYISFRERGNSG